MTAAECAAHCTHEPERDRWTRPVVDGQVLMRASTAAKLTDDQSNLMKWGKRNTAKAIAANIDLAEAVMAAGDNDAALNRIVDDAEARIGVRSAASRGTSLHSHIATINLGRDLPPGLGADTVASLDAYRRLVFDRLGLVPRFVEQFVVDAGLKIAGSFDAVFEEPGGRLLMSDLKTGAKSWERSYPGATQIQLAIYQGAQRWCPSYGSLPTPLTEPDDGLLISLPVGKGECWVDVLDLEAGRRGLEVALALRGWRGEKSRATPYSGQPAVPM